MSVAACGTSQKIPAERGLTHTQPLPKTIIGCDNSTAQCRPKPTSDKPHSDAIDLKPSKHPIGQLKKTDDGYGSHRVTCPNPAVATTQDPRQLRSDANARMHIHDTGVGAIRIGEPVPDVVSDIEGVPYDAAFKKAAQSMNHYDAMAAGYFNMAGYPTIRLKNLDLTMTLAQEERVLLLTPGPQILTKQGTGVGSALTELIRIYGEVHFSSLPEPYHCGASVAAAPRMVFLFTTCEAACAGERVQKVNIGGANYDYSAQEWRIPHRYPLKP